MNRLKQFWRVSKSTHWDKSLTLEWGWGFCDQLLETEAALPLGALPRCRTRLR